MDVMEEVATAVAQNLGASVADPSFLRALVSAIVVGVLLFLGGQVIARRTGVLVPDASDGERVGLGLACGLIIAAAGIALLASGGRSAYTPVAIAFVLAIAVPVRRSRLSTADDRAAQTRLRPYVPGASSVVVAVGLLVSLSVLLAVTI